MHVKCFVRLVFDEFFFFFGRTCLIKYEDLELGAVYFVRKAVLQF